MTTNDHQPPAPMLVTHGEVDAGGRRCLESLLANGDCRSAEYRGSTASTNGAGAG